MSPPSSINAQGLESCTRIKFRDYQWPVFLDRDTGVLVLHWSRQIGKSFTLAAWAVDRLLSRPGRLVTVLSNSRDNGAEFLAQCAEICRLNNTKFETEDQSPNLEYQNMRLEIRIVHQRKTGRIKVLAANPRTARGFSGDLILDEFAFHEDSAAIWEAAEPILASNSGYLCRIASTGNGRHNLFYRMASGAPASGPADRGRAPGGAGVSSVVTHSEFPISSALPASSESPFDVQGSMLDVRCSSPSPSSFPLSSSAFPLSRVTRTQAHAMGVKIFDPSTRESISPEEARRKSLDKRAYDQNYECVFADENATLLSHELISAAERDDTGFICEQDWANSIISPGGTRVSRVPDGVSPFGALALLHSALGPLYVGFDVARKGDLSVITVIEDLNGLKIVRAILRMQNLRLPEQQQRLGEICRLPKFRRAAIDMTGLGLGLFEYAQEEFGASRIHGINFATSVPATRSVLAEGRKRETVRVTEAMAMELLQVYEDRRIQHPADARLRDDLRKPEKITTPGGRVSIAATRDEAGHADHFWSFALALEAASHGGGSGAFRVVERPRRYLL